MQEGRRLVVYSGAGKEKDSLCRSGGALLAGWKHRWSFSCGMTAGSKGKDGRKRRVMISDGRPGGEGDLSALQAVFVCICGEEKWKGET